MLMDCNVFFAVCKQNENCKKGQTTINIIWISNERYINFRDENTI